MNWKKTPAAILKGHFPDKITHSIDAVRYSREFDMRNVKNWIIFDLNKSKNCSFMLKNIKVITRKEILKMNWLKKELLEKEKIVKS